MEKIGYIRKVGCEICQNKLLSVYVRSKNNFKSLEGYYYCENCKKIYKIDSN